MSPRMTDYFERAEPAFKAMFTLEAALKASPLDAVIVHLVKVRASQINGCAYCIHMHVGEALKDGENPMRLHLLAGWRDSSLYSTRERAALAWTEALTLVSQTHAPDTDWAALEAVFTADEQAWLTVAIGSINVWNRVQVGFRAEHPVDRRHAV